MCFISGDLDESYGDGNFGCSSAIGHLLVLAVDATRPDLLKCNGIVGVSNLIPNDGVAQLGNQIHERLLSRVGEGNVSRPASGSNDEGVMLLEVQVLFVNGVYAHEVGAQVRDQQKLALGIQHGGVRMRRFLARRDRPRLAQLEEPGLDGFDGGWVRDVPGCKSRAAT